MNSYVNYQYYAEEYRGDLEEREFDKASLKATAHVRRITFGRADFCAEDDEVKLATCAVCDIIAEDKQRREANNGMNIASENTDGYSVSYIAEQAVGESTEELLNRKIYDAAKVYLAPTGLLSWGI